MNGDQSHLEEETQLLHMGHPSLIRKETTATTGVACHACKEPYSGTVIPRVLCCGHSQCHFCINQQINSEKRFCHSCMLRFVDKHVEEFPVNLDLLAMINMKEKNSETTPLTSNGSITVKAYLMSRIRENQQLQVCRICLPDGLRTTYDKFMQKLSRAFGTSRFTYLTVQWKDSENDIITVSSDDELMEVFTDILRTQEHKVIRVYATKRFCNIL